MLAGYDVLLGREVDMVERFKDSGLGGPTWQAICRVFSVMRQEWQGPGRLGAQITTVHG